MLLDADLKAGLQRPLQAAIFLGAFLLFLLELISAKQLAPIYGGSSAVWITCLVFFQIALLAGYGYAHWLSRERRPLAPDEISRNNALMRAHIALLAAAAVAAGVWCWLPATSGAGTGSPVSRILLRLTLTTGLPFLVLGATSPLLQVWAARLSAGRVPYRFYGLSNLASLLALAAYPTLLEPFLALRTQRLLWTAAFTAFLLLSFWLTRLIRQAARSAAPAAVHGQNPSQTLTHIPSASATPSTRDRLLWVLLPLAASLQLSAVTAHLSANIAAIPLLWILPLAVYLLSLIFAFQFPRLLPQGVVLRLLAVMLASLAYLLSKVDVSVPITIGIPFYLLELFVAAQFCHAATFALRPGSSADTTRFYLYFAAGGALGAVLVGIAFPLVFSANYDLAIAFLLTAAVAAIALWPQGWSQRLLWSTGTVLLAGLLGLQHTAYHRSTLFTERNFYGTLRVQQVDNGHDYPTRVLANGTIRHGTQIFSPELQRTPTTYYARGSGVGLALRFCCGDRPRRVGVIGLGTGTLAAYGQPGDIFRFYEINPAVLPVAQNLFTYLRQSPAHIDVVEGDARTTLTHENPQHFDVLVVDAFSGDAIPLHLLTAEAMQLYLRHLQQDGVLALHISNQHVDLQPAVALLAQHAGLESRVVSNQPNDSHGEFRSTWMLVTRHPEFFAQPEVAAVAQPAHLRSGLRLWTDNNSSLLPLLR